MWKLISTEKYERRKKRFTKKKDEIEVLKALLANLKSLENILNYGKRINEIKFGWLHKETRGILAITEKGGHQEIKLSKIKAGRLYIYPDEEKKILYLLTIGDKNSQENDIKECVSLLNKLGKKNG